MNDNTLTPDRYAGDEAWQDWFDICSVGGCPAAHAAALRRQVESAMYSTLLKRGVSRVPFSTPTSSLRARGRRKSH